MKSRLIGMDKELSRSKAVEFSINRLGDAKLSGDKLKEALSYLLSFTANRWHNLGILGRLKLRGKVHFNQPDRSVVERVINKIESL